MLTSFRMNLLHPILLVCLAIPAFAAEAPRALPQGQLPDDGRLQPLKDLDGYFPWTPLSSKEAWSTRAEILRTQMRVALGILPEPTKTPLNAVIHGRVDRDDYTVDRVFFESFPGHYVTGNLYRPKSPPKDGKMPGILSAHGHWPKGRFTDYGAGTKETDQQLAIGAERWESGARMPLHARCVQLARMGCAVFFYDMPGYADSVQIAEHRSGRRPDLNG